ncbi:MAG: c-type cytochrome [Planctomycetota bacterium]
MKERARRKKWLVAGLTAAPLLFLLAGWILSAGPAARGDVEKGRLLFEGKGNCTLCHTVGGGDTRGPDLAGIGGRALELAEQFGLRGREAGTLYLVRSLVRPETEVRAGYNPMPESWLPSRLENQEIRDLVVYLQSLGGLADRAAVVLPEAWLAAKRDEYARELELFSSGDSERGRKLLFEDRKKVAICLKCHRIDGDGKDICPDLSMVHRVQRPGYILESILDSSRFIVRGYRELMMWDKKGTLHMGLPRNETDETITLILDQEGNTEVVRKDTIDEQRYSEASKMPANFGELLTAQEVMDIVAFLLEHEQRRPAGEGAEGKPDEASTTDTGTNTGTVPPPSLEVFGPSSEAQRKYRMAMERGDPAIGARLYGHYCVMCHGADGSGGGFNAVNLETKPANHTDDRRMSKTDDRLLHGVITRGGMKTGRSFLMPPWGGTFAEREIWDLVAYLRTLHTDLKR